MPIRPDLLQLGQRVRIAWVNGDGSKHEILGYFIGCHDGEYRFQAAPLCPILALMALDDGTLRDETLRVAEVLNADPS